MIIFFPLRSVPFFKNLAFTLILIISSLLQCFSQPVHQHRELMWYPVHKLETGPGDSIRVLNFKGAASQILVHGFLPVFMEMFPLNAPNEQLISLSIENPVYGEFSSSELSGVKDLEKVTSSIIPEGSIKLQRNSAFLSISFVPIRKKDENGNFERLLSFDIVYEVRKNSTATLNKSTRVYADRSVLSTGTWFKMSIPLTGIYILQAKDLINIDPAFSTVDPSTIQIFGNDGGMLPESNATSRIDDLRELSIQVVGSDPSKLNTSDYIIFYAKGPDTWQYDSTDKLFHHQKNIYSNFSCCFLTYGQATGKRVTTEPSVTDISDTTINRFNDYTFYEPAEINLIKSGRAWYSKNVFQLTNTYDYPFSFANLVSTVPVSISATVAAHCTSTPTSFILYANGQQLASTSIQAVGTDYTDTFAFESLMKPTYTSSSSSIDLKLTYTTPNNDGTGYLRALELNVMRNLVFSSGQMAFRSVAGWGPGLVSEFDLTAGSTPVTVWDVSDPGNVRSIGTTQSGNLVIFRLHTDTLREFTAFDGSSFYPVQSFTKIDNQDLHGETGKPDLLIVTNSAFISQANTLASFHQQHDQMNVLVITPDKIYNEFSSGAQDITAIRDFVKMIYDRSGNTAPKYVLIFGDASYDYKDRLQPNSNFVPTYESAGSLDPTTTFVTDDYFGIMADNAGQGCYGLLDIGVGRFPVQTGDQADAAVKKVMHYCSNSDSVMNDWRNVICFIGDEYINENFCPSTDTIHIYDSIYNIDKIYLGAYDGISNPGGLRYPEVNAAINQRMSKGCLVMNYIGHGGTLGWSNARILQIPDIEAWTNFNNMPVFLTATCEFSYFDDPSFTSAGELVFLNPNGGGIALLTTTRPTYAEGNQNLVTGFYMNAFRKTNGNYPTLGDLIMDSKNYSGGGGGDPNTLKFVLLGDPAMKMAYPNYRVVTTSIQTTGNNASSSDTLRALSTVTVTGEIRDNSGNRLKSFNGTVIPTVFDKPSVITTVPGYDGDYPFTFSIRKNVIYKGRLAVTAGQFSFSFIVPKDIAYNFGGGKISYYAMNGSTDAAGYDMNVTVGGFNNDAGQDNEGPGIRLFMNDTMFISGGITNQNPNLLAYLSDSSGINTVGNGIGHDLTATLDDDYQSPVILDDYYVADLNTFKQGIITYPFSGLSDGMHTVSVKVWDVYNNSSEASLDFLVVSSAEMAVQHLLNYPNPFNDKTTFSFEYNQPDTYLEVQIDIYSLNGQKVKTLRVPIHSDGFRVNTIEWDGSSDNGVRIGSGTYVYSLKVILPDGSATQKSSKLVVIR
jgi:hypothetical protein